MSFKLIFFIFRNYSHLSSVTSVTVEVYTNVFGALAKLLKATVSFLMSVCLHGTVWLPLGRFS